MSARLKGFKPILIIIAAMCWAAGWSAASIIVMSKQMSIKDTLSAMNDNNTKRIVTCRNFISLPLYALSIHIGILGAISLISKKNVSSFYESSELFFHDVFILNPMYLGACITSSAFSSICLAVAASFTKSFDRAEVNHMIGVGIASWLSSMTGFFVVNMTITSGTTSAVYLVFGALALGMIVYYSLGSLSGAKKAR